MKNAVFCDVKPCGFYKKGRFGGTYRLHHLGDKNRRRGKRSSESVVLKNPRGGTSHKTAFFQLSSTLYVGHSEYRILIVTVDIKKSTERPV
jgi:hypothetical protein